MAAGDQFDACTNYLLTAACLSFFPGRHLDLEAVLRVGGFRGQVWPIDARGFAERIDWLLGLYHPDVTRVQLNALDSHDTPRFLTCASGDLATLRLALTFLFTVPGTPCLFYGDEVGLSGGNDPDCRRTFVWAEEAWDKELLHFTRNLIGLRHRRREWRWGTFTRLHAEDGVYAFERHLDDRRSVTALNTSDELQEITLDSSSAAGAGPARALGRC